MGFGIPQYITETKASGAQVVDGSLKFKYESSDRLWRNINFTGSRRKFTMSCWLKPTDQEDYLYLIGCDANFSIYITNTRKLQIDLYDTNGSGTWATLVTTQFVFRDDNAFYNIVIQVDTEAGTGNTDRLKVYVNGEPVKLVFATYGGGTITNDIKSLNLAGKVHQINSRSGASYYNSFYLTQYYYLDGMAIGPGFFGFSDPQTGTWRPRRLTHGDSTVNDGRSFSSIGTFTNWDDDGNYPKTELFDGTVYTGGTPNGATADTNAEASFDFGDQRITGFSNLKINLFVSSNQASATNLVSVNGVDITSEVLAAGNNTWTTVDLGDRFSTLKTFRIKNYYVYVGGFIIDNVIMQDNTNTTVDFGQNGFYLPLDGSAYVGKDLSRSNPINNGTIWSDNLTSTSGSFHTAPYGRIAGFNVTVGNGSGGYVQGANSSNPNNLTLTCNIPFTSTVEVYLINNANTVTVNGGSAQSIAQDQFVTVATGPGVLTSLKFERSSTNGASFSAIRVDGFVLQDNLYGNSLNVSGFQGSGALDKATGALPIFNTTSGGKVATVGVRTDAVVAAGVGTCVLAVPMSNPMPGNWTDESNKIDVRSAVKTVTYDANANYSTAQSHFYGASSVFDGTNDKVSIDDHDQLDGFDDFTIELWWYCSTLNSGEYLLAKGDSYMPYMIYNSGSDILEFYASSNNSSWDVASGVAFGGSVALLNKWNHVAVTRQGSSGKLFLNGQLVNFFNSSTRLMTNSSDVTVFADVGGGAAPVGYAQDLRIYSGVAKYTESFIPASPKPDIVPDTPSGVSGGSALAEATEGAVQFDGRSYLSVPPSTDLSLVEGDWTVECYAYISGKNGSYGRLWYLEAPDSTSNTDGVYFNDSHFSMGSTGGSAWSVGDGSGGDYCKNRWHHIAVVHDSTNMRMYIDGRQTLSTSNNFYNYNKKGITIMATANPSFTGAGVGLISNFRVVKGTALYTSDFVPSYAPLTNVTNTKLLCCTDNEYAQRAIVSPQDDSYSAGVYLTALTYTDRGTSGCTVTNNNTVSSTSAGTNSFGLTNGAAMTGTQRVEIILGNHAPLFFEKQWTLEFYFKTSSVGEQMFIGTLTSGSSWQTGWGLDVTSGRLYWDYDGASAGNGKADLGIDISVDTWYFCRVQRTPSVPAATVSHLFVEVYDSPTNLVGDFEGEIGDEQLHANNGLKIGDVNDLSSNLTGNWVYANVMVTGGYHRRGTVPTLLSGQRAVGTIGPYVTRAGQNSLASPFNPFNDNISTVRGQNAAYVTWGKNRQFVGIDLSNGNLKATMGSGGRRQEATHTFTSGKYYWEGIGNNTTNGTVGGRWSWCLSNDFNDPETTGGDTFNAYWHPTAGLFFRGGLPGTNINVNDHTYVDGDVLAWAVDADQKISYVYKNGSLDATIDFSTYISDYHLNLHGITPHVWNGSSGTPDWDCNFGQQPFKFAPPKGFQALNTASLRPQKVIARSDQYVGIATYKGNGSYVPVRDYKFKPDFVWIKGFTDPDRHGLYDTVRGATKRLQSSETAAEDTYNGVISFNDDGFEVGDGAETNGSARGYVAWGWKAGGNKNTFNIDDQGFATAAEAQMSAGALNSESYTQGAVYSNNVSASSGGFGSGEEATKGFDGNYSTKAKTNTNGASITITFSDVTVNSLLRIRTHYANSSGSGVTVNGISYGGVVQYSDGAWFTVTGFTGSLKSIVLSAGGSVNAAFSVIEVDGKILTDNNITAPNSPSLAPTGCSVGTKQGFSIVKWTGTGNREQIPHGLNESPSLIILKETNKSADWSVYTSDIDELNYYIPLNSTSTKTQSSYATPTPQSFTYEGANGDTLIAYCWHNVPGQQKFGTFEGNNNVIGTYVELGFKPALVIVKAVDSNQTVGGSSAISWLMYDSKRMPRNPAGNPLYANLQAQQNKRGNGSSANTGGTDGNDLDGFLLIDTYSNGFKCRVDAAEINTEQTHLYMAWAEAPEINLFGTQATAR